LIKYWIGRPLYANIHKVEIKKHVASALSGKEELSIDNGETYVFICVYPTSQMQVGDQHY